VVQHVRKSIGRDEICSAFRAVPRRCTRSATPICCSRGVFDALAPLPREGAVTGAWTFSQVIWVSATAPESANFLFGGADPIGRRLPEPLGQPPEIVGVVKDARFSTVRADPRPPIYVALGPEPDRFNAILIRTSADPSFAVAAIQQAVQQEHPWLLLAVHTMREEIDRSITRERMVAAVSTLFGSLGLVLVSVGVFGVAAYTMGQRTNELGIRIALGASNWDVIRESLVGTLVPFIAGLIAGVMLALAGIRLMEGALSGLLYELTPSDSRNIAFAVGVMLAAAIVAAAVPAYRAASVDPNSAIRSE
jgi:hypothetical protein